MHLGTGVCAHACADSVCASPAAHSSCEYKYTHMDHAARHQQHSSHQAVCSKAVVLYCLVRSQGYALWLLCIFVELFIVVVIVLPACVVHYPVGNVVYQHVIQGRICNKGHACQASVQGTPGSCCHSQNVLATGCKARVSKDVAQPRHAQDIIAAAG